MSAEHRTKVPNPLISKLPIGRQLTYKELVTLLDEEFIPANNRARETQLEEFRRMFSFSLEPRWKITIDAIYPEVLPAKKKARGRPRKNPNFGAQIEPKKRGRPRKVLTEEEYTAKKALEEQRQIKRVQREQHKKEAEEDQRSREEQMLQTSCPLYLLPPTSNCPVSSLDFSSLKLREAHVRRGPYFSPIANVVLRYLPYHNPYQNGYIIYVTPRQLKRTIGLINPCFTSKSYNSLIKAHNPTLEITPYEFNWFIQAEINILDKAVKGVLAALMRLDLISWSPLKLILKDGDSQMTIASDEEEQFLRDSENAVLKQFGFSSLKNVYLNNREDEYYHELKNYCWSNYGIVRCTDCYGIELYNTYPTMNEEEYDYWKQAANALAVSSFEERLQNAYINKEKKRQEIVVGKPKDGDLYFYLPPDFDTHQIKLIDLFIRLKDNIDDDYEDTSYHIEEG